MVFIQFIWWSTRGEGGRRRVGTTNNMPTVFVQLLDIMIQVFGSPDSVNEALLLPSATMLLVNLIYYSHRVVSPSIVIILEILHIV